REGGRPRAGRAPRGAWLRLDQGRGRGRSGLMAPSTVSGLDVTAVRREFPVLDDGVVYLDSAASAQKPRAVLDALQDTFAHHYANIHRGVYSLSQEATELFEGARRFVASWIGASFEEVVFTKNVTEAINLVAYSWGRSNIGEGD